MSQFFNMRHVSHFSHLRNMQNQNNGLVWINDLRKKTSNHSHNLQAIHVADHEKKEILLLLEDNGKGFEEGKGKKGIGLKNLKERVEEIHGSFHIESTEQGTKTTISIPINGR